jgi:hypothetical protein
VSYGKALIGTGLVVSGDAYKWVSEYLAGAKKVPAAGGEKGGN